MKGDPQGWTHEESKKMLAAWASLLFLAMWVRNATSGPLSFRIAAILDDPMECSRGERLAITLAKESINRSSNRSTTGKLEVDIFELLRDSEYETGETMCQIMSKGVVAVLGPSASPASNSIISNICGEKEVPYVKVAPEDILKVQFPRFTTLDLRPTNTDISMAVAGLLTFFNSSTSCLICAQADCIHHLSYPIHLPSNTHPGANVNALCRNRDVHGNEWLKV